ncbi:MAG: hypothetical protein HC932_01535 [Thermales bacterium]|nr:hypothetical protein [Thermales bacterium]
MDFDFIARELAKYSILPNKTSIYRQLDLMDNIYYFQVNKKRYWTKVDHKNHQHICCKKCNKISCLNLNKSTLLAIQSRIEIGFEADTFELMSTCKKCR